MDNMELDSALPFASAFDNFITLYYFLRKSRRRQCNRSTRMVFKASALSPTKTCSASPVKVARYWLKYEVLK